MIKHWGIPLLFSVFLLTGCSTLGMAGAASSILSGGGGPSLDAELTLGDKTQEVNTDFGDKNEQQATVINNVEEVDPLLILIAVIGWLLPGPGTMWRELTSLIPWRRKK